MCGIFGALLVSPAPSAVGEGRLDVDAALDSIAYRGPDDRGVFHDDGVVLAHNRLSVLDLSPLGHQPMASADGDAVVVFNGEIYNHHELRDELASRGHRFRSRSDTEVIVEGYRVWGEAVVEKLDGMFAIAIYDRRARRLVLARDRAGKKPLFYAHANGGIRFASEVKAILASGFAAEIDATSLPSMLAMGYVHAPRSMYRGVAQLEPASIMTFEAGKEPRIRRYWRFPAPHTPLRCTVQEASSEVRRLLEKAVERRLEADVPLGAFLSGGVDSTIIVGLMAKLAGRKVKTFSIGFTGDPRYDETHYARIAARAFDTDHVEFTLEPSSFDLVERLVAAHDGPFGDSSAIPTSVVSGLTRKHVTVALTGDGGDELFCGYPRFLAAEAAEMVPLDVRRAGALLARALPGSRSERTLLARARRFLSSASLPLADRLLSWSPFFARDLEGLLRPEILAIVSAGEPLAYNRGVFTRTEGATSLTRILEHNFETYLPDDLLVKADRSSMIHSLELRSPFLDTALIEYVAQLPDSMKRRGTVTKWILKHAFRDLLPPAITSRGKMGFTIPLGAWFRTDLRTRLLDYLGPSARIHEYLRRAPVESLLREHFEGAADHGHRLWLLLTMEIWLRSLMTNHP